VPAYEFQIPTPWHNSLIKVEGDDIWYLARAEIAKAAISASNSSFEGSWVDSADGAHFSLRRNLPVSQEVPSVVSAKEKKFPIVETVEIIPDSVTKKSEAISSLGRYLPFFRYHVFLYDAWTSITRLVDLRIIFRSAVMKGIDTRRYPGTYTTTAKVVPSSTQAVK
jgi:hypothetical protein